MKNNNNIENESESIIPEYRRGFLDNDKLITHWLTKEYIKKDRLFLDKNCSYF